MAVMLLLLLHVHVLLPMPMAVPVAVLLQRVISLVALFLLLPTLQRS